MTDPLSGTLPDRGGAADGTATGTGKIRSGGTRVSSRGEAAQVPELFRHRDFDASCFHEKPVACRGVRRRPGPTDLPVAARARPARGTRYRRCLRADAEVWRLNAEDGEARLCIWSLERQRKDMPAKAGEGLGVDPLSGRRPSIRPCRRGLSEGRTKKRAISSSRGTLSLSKGVSRGGFRLAIPVAVILRGPSARSSEASTRRAGRTGLGS